MQDNDRNITTIPSSSRGDGIEMSDSDLDICCHIIYIEIIYDEPHIRLDSGTLYFTKDIVKGRYNFVSRFSI